MTVGNTPPTVGDAAVSTDATAAVSGTVAVNDPDAGQTVTLTISVCACERHRDRRPGRLVHLHPDRDLHGTRHLHDPGLR